MEFFRKMLSAIGITSSANHSVDFISALPIEVAQHLLRMLDARTLLNTAKVSRRWLAVCKSDLKLRKSAKRLLRKQRRVLEQNCDTVRKHKNASHTIISSVNLTSLKISRLHDFPVIHRTFRASAKPTNSTGQHKLYASSTRDNTQTRRIMKLR